MVYVVKNISVYMGSGVSGGGVYCLGVPGGRGVSIGLSITKGYKPLARFASQQSHHRLIYETNNAFLILFMTRLISNVKYGPLKQSAPPAAL